MTYHRKYLFEFYKTFVSCKNVVHVVDKLSNLRDVSFVVRIIIAFVCRAVSKARSPDHEEFRRQVRYKYRLSDTLSSACLMSKLDVEPLAIDKQAAETEIAESNS